MRVFDLRAPHDALQVWIGSDWSDPFSVAKPIVVPQNDHYVLIRRSGVRNCARLWQYAALHDIGGRPQSQHYSEHELHLQIEDVE